MILIWDRHQRTFIILPKKHFANVCELDKETAAKVLPLGAKIGAAMKKGLGCAGFNLVQNNGSSRTDCNAFSYACDPPL